MSSFQVESMTRGNLVITDGQRKVTVEGEVLPFAKPGETSYVAYLNSIKEWTTIGGSVAVSPQEKAAILAFILSWAKDRMTIEIE